MEAENQVVVQTQVAEKQEEDKNTVVDFKMVTFSLADKDYSLDIMHVKEIVKADRFTFVPNTMAFVRGVYNLRGEIIPILDLRLFFGVEVQPKSGKKLENIIILAVDDQKFGVIVDKIDKVVGIQKSTIQPPHPLFGDINIKYIDGVVEANNRLYVLLDITRIFSGKDALENVPRPQPTYTPPERTPAKPAAARAAPEGKAAPSGLAAKAESMKAAEAPKSDFDDQAYKFAVESLANYKKFYVSSVNESWVRHRFTEWTKAGKSQIQNEADAEEFLSTFWSSCTGKWWTKEFADAVEKILPDNSAKQIIVWNPGCGKGTESYSLACVLARRYPKSKIRVYAQDVDLLTVSNAAMMSIPAELADDWYSSYLTKKANGEYTFNQDIKDSIMFEYHDCKNTNALPMVDIVFARDVVSMLDEASQNTVVADFQEKMKGNGIAILGENETMPASFNFGENTVGALVAYNKD
ncbi:Chemotaxis signal transduction protein [Treponema sp. JC4]|uniref:CheR family methyltransferase n=1 Tax=Treponema sp. JC4 TaxID=1124982 RepID=UPI00025B02C8|nr:CheR family methyltransferase [Treponema sp. JC4]EID85307.1 Chemotaxis signal transduction protein [Treponema sp. JC4]